MGREAQKQREVEEAVAGEEGAAEVPEQGKEQEGRAVQIDAAMLDMLSAPGMTAMEDRRFLVQTVAVGKKDANGLREITFPITSMKTITLVLAEDLQEHILKEFSGGIEVADLSDLEAVKRAAAEAEEKS